MSLPVAPARRCSTAHQRPTPSSSSSRSSSSRSKVSCCLYTYNPHPAIGQAHYHRRAPFTKQQQQQGRLQRSSATAASMDSSSSSSSRKQLPFLCGLTGSIGMGKSTVSGFFTQQDVPVLCADEVVHTLYSAGGAAVAPVGAAFPSAVVDGAIDRPSLSKCVVGNEAAMKQLERIVHPLVEQERAKFIQEYAAAGSPLLLFDIPLLYETNAQQGLDAVLVVSAPAELQRQRVMARPGMTAEKLDAILARQVPDEEKRRLADYVVDTGCSMEQTQQQVVELIRQLKGRQGTAAARALGSAVEQ